MATKPSRGFREVETGAGAYRQGTVSIPIPPRVSRVAVGAAATLTVGLVSLAIVLVDVAWRLNTDGIFAFRDDAPQLWQTLLWLSVRLVPTCLVVALILATIARRRIAEHPELRGESVAGVVGAVAKATLGMLGCIVIMLGVPLGLLYWLFKDYNMGRPLRRRGKAITARPRLRATFAPGAVRSANFVTQWTLGAMWGRAASLEHAAVAAFEQLREQLTALGAPADLIARMERARIEEAEHAALCFRLAGRWTGWQVGPGRLPPIERTSTLDRLAAEQIRDGCLMEAYAAAMADEGARATGDVGTREVLTIIARDEARHAEDAYAVLEWLLSIGGHRIAKLVERELECLPQRAPQMGPPWTRLLDLSSYGFPSAATANALYASVRAQAIARIVALLKKAAGDVPRTILKIES